MALHNSLEEWEIYISGIKDKIANGEDLTMDEAIDAVDAGLVNDYPDITTQKRNVKSELTGLKLNVRISRNVKSKKILDLYLYNHSKEIHYMKLSIDGGYSADIFEMYSRRYELSVYSESRIKEDSTPLTDDFNVCIQGYDEKLNHTFGEFYMIENVTFVDSTVVPNESIDTRADAKEIGRVDKWVLYRAQDKSEYFFKSDKKVISGTSIQTAVEKFVISNDNTNGLDIDQVKRALGIDDVKFAYDLSLSERQESVRKELIKAAQDTKEEYENYLAKVAITAMRELSNSQREIVYKEIEKYAKDPEKQVEGLEVSI